MTKIRNLTFRLTLILFLIIFLIGFFGSAYCQPLKTIKFDLEKDNIIDSSDFDKLIQNVKVFGIGEATHGDHESQLLRKTLIYNLIKNNNFSTICIEERNINVRKINQIIHSDSIVSNQKIEQTLLNFDYWIWKNNEFIQIIKMLNLYNLSSFKKISIMGVDTFVHGNTNTRDSIMANKVFEIAKLGKRVIYLAHNYHVSFQEYSNKKYAGAYLKEKLGNDYYSIGILFNSGCFNAFSKLGFKTHCVQRPKRLNKLARYIISQNDNYVLIDFKSMNNFNTINDKINKKDYNWHIGAGFEPDYNSYWKSQSLLKSWDAIFFIDTISESKSFQIPGNFFAKAEITLGSKTIEKVTKDSFIVSFKINRMPMDSSLGTEFFIQAYGKDKIHFFNQSTTDFYRILRDSFDYKFTFPCIKKAQKYSFGFDVWGNGQILISNFEIIGYGNAKLIYDGLKDFEFIGGNRFDIEKTSFNKMLIFQLKK